MFAFLSFLAFTSLVAAISWWKTRNDDQSIGNNYFLAGRSLPWFVVTGSLMLTNLSTEQLVGLNGGGYMHGFVVIAWEVIAATALVVMAWKFLPIYWSGQITTVPQFLEKRFDSQTRTFVSVLFLLALAFSFLPFILYSGALAMNGLFDVAGVFGITEMQSIFLMVWVIGIVGALYAILGGLEAVAISDTINGVGLLFGGLLIPFLGLMALGDGHLFGGIERIVDHQRPMLDPVGDSQSNIPFSVLFTGMLMVNLFYWCTNQFIIQRTFGAKSLKEAQKGVIGAAVLKLLGPLYLVLPGVIALELFGPNLSNGDLAYPMLVKEVLPTWLLGFFSAVMFGAILSSFNSCLHSASTLFGLDIYKNIIRKDATDKQVVKAGKMFGIGLAIFAMLAAPFIIHAPAGLFTLMKQIGATFSVPVFALVVSGIFIRKAPALGAKVIIFVGIGLYVLANWFVKPTWNGATIHWLHITGITFALLILTMWVFGKMRPIDRIIPAYDLQSSGTTNMEQWSGTHLAGSLVVATVIGMYAFLHWF
ncbi:MAG: solute:sodium symporter family transporter [Verrucomicrobia bacterium]|nr:solute:sodium symporter family transporter [Verrucomicrobiota bacterium]MDA1069438.1 solute:sodium symporter family transporter [Verrucomicrobiota bacterium]